MMYDGEAIDEAIDEVPCSDKFQAFATRDAAMSNVDLIYEDWSELEGGFCGDCGEWVYDARREWRKREHLGEMNEVFNSCFKPSEHQEPGNFRV